MRRIALLQSSFFQINQTIQISQIIWIIQILAGYAAVTDNDADRTMIRHSMAGKGSSSAYGNRKRSRTGVRRGFLTMRSENQTSRMYRLIRNSSLSTVPYRK